MTSCWGHSFATRQLGTFPFCRQLGTVLSKPAGKPAVRQRLSPMTSRLSLSPMSTMTRWLGAGFGACEGEAYGGDGCGEEHGDT